MVTGKIWFFAIFICIVAGTLIGVQHFRGDDDWDAQLIEANSKLSQIKDTLKLRREEWAKVSALAAKPQPVAKIDQSLLAKREQLQARVQLFEEEFKVTVNFLKDAVEKVRAEGVGVEFSELKLLSGKTLKAARIQRIEPMKISFVHTDGITIVTYDELPEEMRERFDMGDNGLADQMASVLRSIQTSDFINASPGVGSNNAPRDHFGVSGIQTMSGLIVDCPIPLNSVASPSGGGNVKEVLMWNGKNSHRGLDATVIVMKVTDNAAAMMNAAVNGVADGLKKSGIEKVSHLVLDVSISGYPAKKCSFTGVANSSPISVESLAIQKGNWVYFMQVVCSSRHSNNKDEAKAIISSAKIE